VIYLNDLKETMTKVAEVQASFSGGTWL